MVSFRGLVISLCRLIELRGPTRIQNNPVWDLKSEANAINSTYRPKDHNME